MFKGYFGDISGSKQVVSCDGEKQRTLPDQTFLLELTPSGLWGRYSYSLILQLLQTMILARECRQEQ